MEALRKLDPDGLQELKDRFGTFHDACIRTVQFSVSPSTAPSVRYVLDAIELPWVLAPEGRKYILDWKLITLEVRELKAFCFSQPERYESSTIFGLTIDLAADEVQIDFDTDGDPHCPGQDWMKEHWRWASGKELWWQAISMPPDLVYW